MPGRSFPGCSLTTGGITKIIFKPSWSFYYAGVHIRVRSLFEEDQRLEGFEEWATTELIERK